jgi:hypothetical protein
LKDIALKNLRNIFFAFFFMFFTFSSSLIVSGVNASNATENTWDELASMPTSRSGLGVTVIDGKIYAVGGSGTSVNEIYNPATNMWTAKKPMPEEYNYFCTVACNNKIYLLGNSYPLFYDPTTNSWTTNMSAPTLRREASACAVNGKIYFMGGSSGGGMAQRYVDANEMYDPATDTWTAKTPMPFYNSEIMTLIVLDDKIYVFAGQRSNYISYIYDPQLDTWTPGPGIPYSVHGGGATTGVNAPKKIYLFGEETIVFDPQTQTVSTGASVPNPSSGVAVVDDIFYLLEGHSNWRYTPFGYVSNTSTSPEATLGATPTNQLTPQTPATLTVTVAGIFVAVAVLAAVSLLLYRNKHKIQRLTV